MTSTQRAERDAALSSAQEMWDELSLYEQGRGRQPSAHDMRRWSAALTILERVEQAESPRPPQPQPGCQPAHFITAEEVRQIVREELAVLAQEKP